jgi:CheY-like chemotaxis protein
MSASTISTPEAKPDRAHPRPLGPKGVERRRRPRAKISAQLRVRLVDSAEILEEVCGTVDVSRDGILFLSSHSGFWPTQPLEITFPYSAAAAAAALNQPQPAEVVRVFDHGNGLFGIGVQFAAAKSKTSLAGSNAPATTGAQPKTNLVLAIEPNQRDAEVIRGALQQDGYSVVIVATARAALEVLRNEVPAAFITDIENPDMSGHDLCLIIKRDERLQNVPVILLTRSARPQDYSAGHQLGAVICMAKPFKPDRLLHVIRLVAKPPQKRGTSAQLNSTPIRLA